MSNWVYNNVTMIGKQKEIKKFMDIGMDVSDSGSEMFNFLNFFTNTDVTINGVSYNMLNEDIQNKIWSEYIQTSNGFYLSTNDKNKTMSYESKWYPSLGFYITFGLMFDITFIIECCDEYGQYWNYVVYKGKVLYRNFLQHDEDIEETILKDDFMVYKENKFELDKNGKFNLKFKTH